MDFKQTGTRDCVFATAWTCDPAPLAADLTNLRFRLIRAGHRTSGQEQSSFHACDDPAPLRDAVITAIQQHLTWSFAAMVVDKRRVNPSLSHPRDFYPKFLTLVLKFVFRGSVRASTPGVLIYTDSPPCTIRKDSVAIEVAIRKACRLGVPAIPFHVCHPRRERNPWLQVADSCSWLVQRHREHDNRDDEERMKPRLAAAEIDPMSRGDGRVYY